MASEPPFGERSEHPPSDEGIQPVDHPPHPVWATPLPPESVMEPGTLPPPVDAVLDALPAPRPPGPPQPGFWLGVLLTFVMIVLCQVVIPVAVVVILLLGRSVAGGPKAMDPLGSEEGLKQFQAETMLPLLVAAHVPMILLGLVALRVFAGRYWYREIALRLPSFTHFILLILLFPALPILGSGAYMLAQQFVPGLGEFPALFLSQIAMVLVLGAVWLAFREQWGYDPKRQLARSPVPRQLLLAAFFIAVALATARGTYFLISLVIPEVQALAQLDKSMEELVAETRHWSALVAVLVIAVMPAFSEEIWCRAFLGRGLVGQYGVVCGVLITSYFFGAIHVLPHQGAMAMLMGIVLHYAYLTTRSLLAPMLLHFLNNATSVLGERLGEQAANIDTAPERVPITLYVGAALLLAAVVWALYQSRARLVGSDVPTYIASWRPTYPGVALPPWGSGAAIVQPWPSAAAIGLVLVMFTFCATAFTLATLGYHVP
jgi:membrane protease YdiL (CAAX protease family)